MQVGQQVEIDGRRSCCYGVCKAGQGEDERKHEKKEREKSHQATGKGKTERRKRGGGGGGLERERQRENGLHRTQSTESALRHHPGRIAGTSTRCEGLAGAGAQVPRRSSHAAADERASPLPVLQRRSLRPTFLGCSVRPAEPALRHEDGQEALRMERRYRYKAEPGGSLCDVLRCNTLASSNQRAQVAFHRRSSGVGPRFQRTSWYLECSGARH